MGVARENPFASPDELHPQERLHLGEADAEPVEQDDDERHVQHPADVAERLALEAGEPPAEVGETLRENLPRRVAVFDLRALRGDDRQIELLPSRVLYHTDREAYKAALNDYIAEQSKTDNAAPVLPDDREGESR